MRTVILDGRRFTDRAAAHDYLKSALELPEWYGRNLDALADCLSEVHQPICLVLENIQALEDNLGDYAHRFLRVLEDAVAVLPCSCICTHFAAS